jgi:quinolinate synthase
MTNEAGVLGKADMNIVAEIKRVKESRKAIILSHNYQPGEIQDIADFTGDSLELARKAALVDEDVVVFCGVHFMAETAAILNPRKTVLLPTPDAGCPMADMITGEQLRELKVKHPSAKVLCYVNSTAEIKAESDCCVTSSNALAVARSFSSEQPIIFVPDQHLGSWTAEQLGRKFILWPGFCPTHARMTEHQIVLAREKHLGAPVLVHPECPKGVRDAADQVLSTGGMCRYVHGRSETAFIVGTETGILHRLQQENPDKQFFPLLESAVCPNMKKTTLEKVLWSLQENETLVRVEEPIASRARKSIEAMLAIK